MSEKVHSLKAVVTGLADEEHYDDIRNLFMGTALKPAYENASIYMEKYVLEALFTMGYSEDAMERMERRYMEIANRSDISTLPELWDGEDTYGEPGTLSSFTASVPAVIGMI